MKYYSACFVLWWNMSSWTIVCMCVCVCPCVCFCINKATSKKKKKDSKNLQQDVVSKVDLGVMASVTLSPLFAGCLLTPICKAWQICMKHLQPFFTQSSASDSAKRYIPIWPCPENKNKKFNPVLSYIPSASFSLLSLETFSYGEGRSICQICIPPHPCLTLLFQIISIL